MSSLGSGDVNKRLNVEVLLMLTAYCRLSPVVCLFLMFVQDSFRGDGMLLLHVSK